jgi:hypothetical protein
LKALFITGSNQYGVVAHFLREMRKDLSLLSFESDLLDVSNDETFKNTAASIAKLSDYNFIVSFNGVGLDVNIDGQQVSNFTSSSTTLYIFLVDHPIHLIHRFIGLPVTVLCVDQEHMGFCQLCGIKSIWFPHAVGKHEIRTLTKSEHEAKTDEILFPVSHFNLEEARKRLKPIWHQVGQILEQCPDVTRFMQAFGVLPSGNIAATVQLDENVRRIIVYADFYMRAKRREAFLETCQQHNRKLTVIGNGSHKYLEKFSLHDYQSAIPFAQLLERMSKAKYVAHNSPGFQMGLHERVVLPLARGSAILTDANYVKKQFPSVSFAPVQKELSPSLEAINAAQIQLTEHTWYAQWKDVLKV